MKNIKLLIIETDNAEQKELLEFLNSHSFKCEIAKSITEAKNILKLTSFDAILLDMNLGNEDGMELIPYISQNFPFTKIVMMSNSGSINSAVYAMDEGASSFISKSIGSKQIAQELKKRVGNNTLTNCARKKIFNDLGLIGDCPKMINLFNELEQLKDVDATLLITGESGTGKELVARALHSISNRSENRFEAINCGAIPENLLESELFGYKKGAFTDAKSDKKGIFEICSDGTLFLDEIGEMPLSLQVKLLRVLQEKEVKPIGSNQTLKINTRVIAATNRNLANEVKLKNFREDLFFRISIFLIDLPALREKTEDIPLIVEFLVEKINKRYQRKIRMPSKEIMARLQLHNWPGNVRELQNSIERAIVFSKDSEMHMDRIFNKNSALDLNNDTINAEGYQATFTEAKNTFEKKYLNRVLKDTKGNVSEASSVAGRFRSDLYRLMEKHHINQNDFK